MYRGHRREFLTTGALLGSSVLLHSVAPLRIASAQRPGAKSTHRAIVIGFGYSGKEKLRGAVKSAETLSLALAGEGIRVSLITDSAAEMKDVAGKPNITEVKLADLKAATVKAAILELSRRPAKAKADSDFLLIAYAGHGCEVEGIHHWNMPAGEAELLNVLELRQAVFQLTTQALVISDSCRKPMAGGGALKAAKMDGIGYSKRNDWFTDFLSARAHPDTVQVAGKLPVPIIYSTTAGDEAIDEHERDLLGALARGMKLNGGKFEASRTNVLSLVDWAAYGFSHVLTANVFGQQAFFDENKLQYSFRRTFVQTSGMVAKPAVDPLAIAEFIEGRDWKGSVRLALQEEHWGDRIVISPSADPSGAPAVRILGELPRAINTSEKWVAIDIRAIGNSADPNNTIRFSIDPALDSASIEVDRQGSAVRELRIGEGKRFLTRLRPNSTMNQLQIAGPLMAIVNKVDRTKWWPEGASLIIERIAVLEPQPGARNVGELPLPDAETNFLSHWLPGDKLLVDPEKKPPFDRTLNLDFGPPIMNRRAAQFELAPVEGKLDGTTKLESICIGGNLVSPILYDKGSHEIQMVVSGLEWLEGYDPDVANLTVFVQGRKGDETFSLAEHIVARKDIGTKKGGSFTFAGVDSGYVEYIAILGEGIRKVSVDRFEVVRKR